MALRTAFIGIDKHEDPAISELAGARRDATALWALFADTLEDVAPRLIVDEQASHQQVRGLLDEVLLQATPDDTVILSFSGHGTRDHRLVLYDTDTRQLPSTTIAMAELGDYFKRSQARAILCIVDCCFSGRAPARVFEDSPAPRGSLNPLEELAGTGRLLIAASSPNEPALEMSGHGLLTEALVHELQEGVGSVDLVGAMGRIMERARGNASRLGYVQTPVLYGHVMGGLSLPVLKRGAHYARAFPEVAGTQVGPSIDDLAAFGIPQPILDEWRSRFADGLNSLQVEAINTHRVLDGQSVVVVAPTSSGKTFIGELAAIRAHLDGRKSVFLLPYRALVNEKYDQFAALYGSALGLRVIRSTGDFLDDNKRFISGQYDLAVMTYEMFLRLAVGSPHILSRLGLVVLDEAQFLMDPKRGLVVELLLTLLLAARDRGIVPQLVALSAVIGNANGFHEWLGCRLLVTTTRPVPLAEGVVDRSGMFEYVDEHGERKLEQILDPCLIRQRRDKPSAQDVIVPLVRQLVSKGQKIIIFRNTKGPAEGCAQYLAKELELPPATDVISQLPTEDLSSTSGKLRACLEGGTAFHDTNLRRDERQTVERAFRDPNSALHVLAATTTVAAGINTPASTVIIAEQEFAGEDGRPFTVAEYKNMAGRAGRLGYREQGTSIILADAEHPRGLLFNRYVCAQPEALRSSFAEDEIDTWVLRLLTHLDSVEKAQVPLLLARTYAGFLASRQDPSWSDRTRRLVESFIEELLRLQLLEEEGGMVRLTLLGRACGRSALSFTSAMRLVELLRSAGVQGITADGLVALVQGLPEADALWAPIVRGRRGEPEWIQEASERFGSHVVVQLQRHASDMREYQVRCKRACVLYEWIRGTAIQAIEERFSKNAFATLTFGSIVGYADGTRFWLGSASDILPLVMTGRGPDASQIDTLLRQLELGIPADALRLAQLPLQLSRGEYLRLYHGGIKDPEQLWKTPREQLEALLPRVRIDQLLAARR